MNQEIIGKFLAEERKHKEYTQKQLAEILNISDKTISKWETGKSLPDLEMMNSLCQIFDISINELLSGERISTEELQIRAEKNIKELILDNESNRKNNRWNIIIGLSVLALSLFMFVIFLFGIDFRRIIWFIDAPSMLIFLCVLISLSLISKNASVNEINVTERCIFPVGVIMSILNLITMLYSSEDIYMKNIAICILPILYSSVVYVVIQCWKIRKIRR